MRLRDSGENRFQHPALYVVQSGHKDTVPRRRNLNCGFLAAVNPDRLDSIPVRRRRDPGPGQERERAQKAEQKYQK